MKIRKEVNDFGEIKYYNEKGELHREDGPAVITISGSKKWYLNGKEYTQDEYNKRERN